MKESKFEITLEHDDPNEIDLTMRIVRNGEVAWEECDRGEPEDQSFYRDWSWVPDACRASYGYGLEDGREGLAETHKTLQTAHAELVDAYFAIMPVLMSVVQSDGAGKALRAALDGVEKALKQSAPKENKAT